MFKSLPSQSPAVNFIYHQVNACSFLCLETKKRTKRKFKEKSNAPHFFPLLTHKFPNFRLPLSEIGLFSLYMLSHLTLVPLPRLMPPRLEHTAGAIFFACRLLQRAVSRSAKNEALENSLQETSTEPLSQIVLSTHSASSVVPK
jgi:hypothetical protein